MKLLIIYEWPPEDQAQYHPGEHCGVTILDYTSHDLVATIAGPGARSIGRLLEQAPPEAIHAD